MLANHKTWIFLPSRGLGILISAFSLTISVGSAQAEVIEEVVVTAEKRAELVQDVPITMQAFTGEQLQNFGVNSVNDVVKLAPNLNIVVQNALSQHIVIRGVGTNEFFGNAPSSVGTYMDEVTMNSSYMSTLGLFDVERVEILRGPQNSLFGRNTTGGAVNYISKMPVVGGEMEGYASALYGSHDRFEVEGAVSIPMGTEVAARIAAMVHTRDGRWDNITKPDGDYGDSDRYSVRGTLLWEPTDATKVTGSFHVARDDSEAQPQKAFGTLDTGTPPILSFTDEQTIFGGLGTGPDIDFDQPVPWVQSQGENVATTDWDDVRTGGSQIAEIDVTGGYLKIEHDFGPVMLTSITAYDETKGKYEEDNGVSGLSSGPLGNGLNQEALVINFDTEYEQFSQEIRFASADESARLRWIAGFYYFTEDSTQGQNIRFGDNGVLLFQLLRDGIPREVAIGLGFPDPGPAFQNTAGFSIAELEDESVSVYGQTEYDITDQLTVTAGLRYTKDDKSNPSYFGGSIDITGFPQSTYYNNDLVRKLTAGLGPCPTGLFDIGCAENDTSQAGVRKDISTEEWGGKLGADYHFTDDIMVYGSYSRGFKSGRYDVEFLHTAATPFPQNPIDVEILDAFEVGVKTTLLDGRMQLNGAFFYNIWEDQQVFNVGARGPEFTNLPESEILGFEADLQWVPVDTWLVSAGFGWLDSEITDASGLDFDLGQGEFQEGHELPLAPEFSANGAIFKDIQIGPNLLTLQVDMRYQSEAKAKYKPSTPIDEYESRFEMNARANYMFGNARQYQVSFFVENLTEEQYCLEKQDLHVLVGAYYCVPNEGELQFGLQGKINF